MPRAIVRIPLAPGQRAYSDLPADHPIYSTVGRVASAWARLEYELDATIIKLFNIPKYKCFCITAQMMGAAPRIRAIIALVDWSKGNKKLIKKLKTFLNKSYDIADKRNRIVHDPLFRDLQTTEASAAAQFRVTTKSKPDFGFRPITVKYASGVVAEIEQHIGRFLQLREEIYSELGASPKKSP